MTQKAHKTDNDKQVFGLGQERHLDLVRSTNHKRVLYVGDKAQMLLTDLTKFKKAEAVDATPQDLSIVLRRAGGLCVLAGPATLD
ncbi:hypothetical protein [Brasilonema sp. UFV-L1]|uniref:hypothetical protein n=1 Tax=Brasilonema sp. UFV-L1 TaxID=2234130 RepID=UPI00145D5A47|nr:hypothetical protein [Brasilonema sp. UFV-L1]